MSVLAFGTQLCGFRPCRSSGVAFFPTIWFYITFRLQCEKLCYFWGYVRLFPCDKWVPVTTAWPILRLRMEERPQIRREAANMLNKQSRKGDKRWYSSLVVGRGADNASPWKPMLRNTHKAKCFLWRQNNPELWRALVSTLMNIRFQKMRGISSLAAEPGSFSRRTLLHGVSM